MSWLFLILINVVVISISALFQRLAMKQEDSDPILSSIIFQLFLGMIVLPYAISQGFVFPPLVQLWPYFLLSTTLYALGTLMFFKSIKLIEASEMTVLAGAGAIVTMIAAYIFLGEHLEIQKYLGAALVLISILVISYRGEKFVFKKGAIWALLATSFFALAVVSDTFVIRTYDAISFAAVMSIFPGIMLCALYPKKILKLPKAIKNIDKNLTIYTLFYSVGVVTFYAALGTGAMISQVSVLAKTNIILTVILAAILIKENDRLWRKVLAASICMIGVMLVA